MKNIPILLMLIETLASPIITTLLATGNVRNYQLIVGGILLMNLPLSYMALSYGMSPEVTIQIAILLSLISLGVRLLMVRSYVGLSIKDYLFSVIFRVSIVSALAIIVPLLVFHSLNINNFPKLLITCLTSWVSTILCIVVFGINAKERTLILQYILKKVGNK